MNSQPLTLTEILTIMGVILGIILAVLSILGFVFTLLHNETRYKLKLLFRLIRPGLSLEMISKPATGIPGILSGNYQKHIHFHHLLVRQEGHSLDYPIIMEVYEPTNRWTFRFNPDLVHPVRNVVVTKPTQQNPQWGAYEIKPFYRKQLIGAVGINREKETIASEYLTWKFKCLGVTTNNDKILIP